MHSAKKRRPQRPAGTLSAGPRKMSNSFSGRSCSQVTAQLCVCVCDWKSRNRSHARQNVPRDTRRVWEKAMAFHTTVYVNEKAQKKTGCYCIVFGESSSDTSSSTNATHRKGEWCFFCSVQQELVVEWELNAADRAQVNPKHLLACLSHSFTPLNDNCTPLSCLVVHRSWGSHGKGWMNGFVQIMETHIAANRGRRVPE